MICSLVPCILTYGLLVNLPLSSTAADSCSSHTSCADCYESSYYCHWCDFDEACHTIGSWYGCSYGADCYSIERCQRLEPETAGFDTRDVFLIVGVGIVVLGVGLWRSIIATNNGKIVDNTLNTPIADDGTYVRNDVMEAGGGGEMDTTNSTSQKEIELSAIDKCHDGYTTNYDLVGDNTTVPASSSNNKLDTTGSITILKSQHKEQSSAKISHSLTNHARPIMTTLAMTAACVSLVASFPRSPQLNICSTKTNWKSILDGIMSGYMQASFEILVSMYNPSLYDVTINTLSGSFVHNDMSFGTFELDAVSIKSHSITDDLVEVTFAPSGKEAYVMMSDYFSHSLNFTVDAVFDISFPFLFNMSLKTKMDNIFIDLSNAGGETDRHLCKCQY